MKLACPKCSHACGLFQRECPECGFALTIGSAFKFYRPRLAEKFFKAASLRCPKCESANPLNSTFCGNCKAHLSVSLATEKIVRRPQNRVQQFLIGVTPATKRRVHWCYLVFSAALLWWMLAYVEHDTSSWIPYMLLSVIYVTVLSFFGLWLIPRQVFLNVFGRAARLVKLGLALNSLSLMLLVQIFIKIWWVRAGTLAALFIVAWFASWLLHTYLLPMVYETKAVFLGSDSDNFGPSTPQGGRARFD